MREKDTWIELFIYLLVVLGFAVLLIEFVYGADRFIEIMAKLFI